MFRGSAPAKIDTKGRLKIPTDFRRTLDERFGPDIFVTSIRGDCALVYPLQVWEDIETRLASMPSTDPTKSRFLRRVSYFGQQVRLDAQGRILIPQLLRDKAAMNGEVVVSAHLDHFVVWNRDRIDSLLDEEPFTEDDLRILTEHGI